MKKENTRKDEEKSEMIVMLQSYNLR